MLILFLAQIKIMCCCRLSAFSKRGCSSPSQPIGDGIAQRFARRDPDADTRAHRARNAPLAHRPQAQARSRHRLSRRRNPAARARCPIAPAKRVPVATPASVSISRQAGAARYVELLADLEQPHAALLAAHIFAARRDQAGPQRDPHLAEVRRDRIGERQTRVSSRKQLPLHRGIDEAVGDRPRDSRDRPSP